MLAVEVNSPLGNSEPTAALSLIDRIKERLKIKPKTLGADKGYGQGPFLEELEKRDITPHVAMKEGLIGGISGTTPRRRRRPCRRLPISRLRRL